MVHLEVSNLFGESLLESMLMLMLEGCWQMFEVDQSDSGPLSTGFCDCPRSFFVDFVGFGFCFVVVGRLVYVLFFQ